MKVLLFVLLAHFALSMNHDDMEAQNERLRESNKALLRALKAMTAVESEVESEVGWLDIMDADEDEFAIAMERDDPEDSSSDDEFELSESDEFDLSESDEFDWDEEEVGGKRRRRRRRRRRRSKPAPKPAPKPQPKPAPKPHVQPAPKPQPKPAPKPHVDPAPRPQPRPVNKKGYTLEMADHECNDNRKELKLGNFRSLDKCAAACRNHPGCKTFIFGKDKKWGRCYDEGVDNKAACAGQFQKDAYDFYELTPKAEFEFAIAMERDDPEIFSDDEFEVAGYDEFEVGRPRRKGRL